MTNVPLAFRNSEAAAGSLNTWGESRSVQGPVGSLVRREVAPQGKRRAPPSRVGGVRLILGEVEAGTGKDHHGQLWRALRANQVRGEPLWAEEKPGWNFRHWGRLQGDIWGYSGALGSIVLPPNSYVEILSPSTSGNDCIQDGAFKEVK